MATPPRPNENLVATVWTEGKTDRVHLRKAAAALNVGLELGFQEIERGATGGDALLQRCRTFAESPQPAPLIFIFDRDVDSIVRAVSDETRGYKAWGNNVFSFALPVPSHRVGHSNICLEFYYSDVELQTLDSKGHRLFLTSEFSEKSGTHLKDSAIHVGHKGKLRGLAAVAKAKIVDAEVFCKDMNIALSKAAFATCVESEAGNFGAFNFVEFSKIFDVIKRIIDASKPRKHIALPEPFAGGRSSLQGVATHSDVLMRIFSTLEISLHLFIAATIRSYEETIVSEPSAAARKVRPIKKLLVQRFKNPSLATIYDLARLCVHLIDESVPPALERMKVCLTNAVPLLAVGQMLDDLEVIFPPDSGRSRLLSKATATRGLLDYVIPEFARYVNRADELAREIEALTPERRPDVAGWRAAADLLAARIEPLLDHVFVLESLESVDSATGTYSVGVRTYSKGTKELSQKSIKFDELEDYGRDTSTLEISSSDGRRVLRLFPFMVLHDDHLFFYRRTKASGYEYFCPAHNMVHVEETKRKFSQAVFNIGARQELFWTEVIPTKNLSNGITANIPSEGQAEFIGRKKQIATIGREILEIPNQNRIVYGVGGVGKTALMIELSRELYEKGEQGEILFDNIVWVSAKDTYYNPTLNIVESGVPQFDSLETVMSAVLEFFGFEDIDGYSTEDKKDLVLELLKENTVLLVLDNFETLSAAHKAAVVRFFDVEVKRTLRLHPANFKVIITSRELIPSGFHQIGLTGLDLREARQLMSASYRNYKSAKADLSEVQKERLHEVTAGIPIVIKHCLGQIYEYNKPFDTVVASLAGTEATKVVEFSFEEILSLLRNDRCQLEVVILLEVISCPLMVRQIAEILERDEREIAEKIPSLTNYQCVKRTNQGPDEKYGINDEIRLLTRRLSQDNGDVAQDIRRRMTKNFTIEKQMDYTSQEMGVLGIFDKYLSERNLLEAERFISEQVQEKPQSILLKYHFAKYLKDNRREVDRAIEILESVREASSDHPNVLRLLVACYVTLDIPNYSKASVYVQQLEGLSSGDDVLSFEVAEFYANWSTSLRMSREISPDPIKEIVRQQRYKEFADKAIAILARLRVRRDEVSYLLARCYFNKWDYTRALQLIDKALSLCPRNAPLRGSYMSLRKAILDQREKRREAEARAKDKGWA